MLVNSIAEWIEETLVPWGTVFRTGGRGRPSSMSNGLDDICHSIPVTISTGIWLLVPRPWGWEGRRLSGSAPIGYA